jgi:hemerythrin-like domain-containing protein
MAKAIEELQLDHANFLKLLKVLEEELAVFDSGEAPDYEIIDSVAAYFTDYAERFHHPLENRIFARLKERAGSAVASISHLPREHERLSEEAASFRALTQSVLQEAEIPRALFHERARRFIEQERAHIAGEEKHFFSKVTALLDEEELNRLLPEEEKESDPLFDKEVKEEYRLLAQRLLDWEKEKSGRSRVA